jgi:hypothetical protein
VSVLRQFDWTAVVLRRRRGTRPIALVYDVWEWNVWECRWQPLSKGAVGLPFENTAGPVVRSH